jgi:hypothetical protein
MTIENNKHNVIGIMSWYYYIAVLKVWGSNLTVKILILLNFDTNSK